MIAFTTVLNYNSTLKALCMNRPLLFSQQEETTIHFAKMLKVNSTLTELHLQKCDIKDTGAERLSEMLVENIGLKYLDLAWWVEIFRTYVGNLSLRYLKGKELDLATCCNDEL